MLLQLDITEQETLNLASGAVSERIKSVARKALLDAKTMADYSFHKYEASDTDAYRVCFKGNEIGIAYRYSRYWQIYVKSLGKRIRSSNFEELKQRIIRTWENGSCTL